MKKPCRKSGKIKFDSHESAAIRAGEILLRSKTKELSTYKCDFCDKWHLTSNVSSDKVLNYENQFTGNRYYPVHGASTPTERGSSVVGTTPAYRGEMDTNEQDFPFLTLE